MATTSNTTKPNPENQNLTRSRSLGRKPKLPSPSEDGSSSDKKPEKPLPNYLKPTISSRPDPVKLLKKNNNNSLDDNQKILRRRSFDRPTSSLTSPSASSSPRVPKSLNVSPSRSRERPLVPREKPVTAQRSSSFHGTRGVPRGGSTSKSPQVATKKSGLSSSSSNTYLKNKKKDSEDVITKKGSEKEITLDTTSMSSGHEEEEEILKSDVKVSDHDHIKEAKHEKEVQVIKVVQDDEDNKSCTPTNVASSIGDEDSIAIKKEEEEEEALINEDETKEKIEEAKEEVNNQDNDKDEVEEEVKEKIDEDETTKKVDIDMKEVESDHKETIEEDKEQEKEEEEEEEEKEKAKEEEESGEEKKREVVVKGAGKKESPTRAYNDVIASKMQENPRKNKVLALAGAFQTVIDYETAASK
ncbi:unnamed protein product [Cochlearia groenlandica]